ncbi:SDR family oxidoreductase [Magnetospirillum sp. UT-4]|uniref:SDR family oxidoreductase n=1 Tax=Magnetospirillum sp. UT-4 TaxID=2681467 RepID=UPI00137F3904|nr:SDR family oxidoreductase [Magnetospirillum sp. UT-4]CAA7618571.1 Dehydrogenase with different specificities [Magnetospirillum sp. UT-4]
MPNVLITGANRGLGLEFARQYAADGWRVCATVRDPAKGKAASDAGAEVYVADVADAGAIARLKGTLAGVAFDLVLNNAGVYGERQAFGYVDPEEFLRVVRINTLGPLLVSEAFAGQMAGRKVIAAVSSKMGSIADNSSGGFYAYRASKAALDMVVKSMAIDLKAQGVIPVALSPGWVRTDMGGPSAPLDAPTAVAGMRKVLGGLTAADAGRFFHFDGSEVPW